ncbi:MAG: diaminopimelate epimerase [Actinomycetota bacterium]
MTTGALQTTGTLRFRKMHGLGNDFVMVDCVRSAVPAGDPAELARAVCDRRFGVGADGLIYIEREQGAGAGVGEFRMRMWNPDGSESEMCGNGIRCVARYLIDEGIVGGREQGAGVGVGGHGIPVQTGAGLLVVEDAGDGMVRVDMGPAHLERGEIGMTGPADEQFVAQPIEALGQTFSGTAVSMGNPHLVLLMSGADGAAPSPSIQDIDLAKLGPELEHNALFPNRTNVHFVQVLNEGHIVQRTWERGAGATLACGTGACASAVAAFQNRKTGRNVDVDLPGGRLQIEYAEDGHVFMTGPATTVYDGEWPLP